MLIGNKRRRLQREKRLGPAREKRPPVVENQQSSLTQPFVNLIMDSPASKCYIIKVNNSEYYFT
ncbi:MAG: hypothetical protein ACE3JN_01440 [Ectobacillus sp.]